ncbi:MAG: peptidylprolyl isomerase, partial [Saprospiraceae bacterium]|nr:peptidylprolyl isomerase [Saprospiraceae bacterium]
APGAPLGSGGPGYQIDAEFGAFHFKGALSAARTPDQVNPQKRSSGSQFFIVQGYKVPEHELNRFAQQKGVTYTEEDRKRYQEEGGYPPLDGEYTVFGQVVDGLEVIDKITGVETDSRNRPREDVRMRIYLIQ